MTKPEVLVVELVSTDAIRPAPWNVRTGHDVAGIADSLRVHGFRDPIEVWRDTGEIVAGEGRYRAALQLELDRVPVIWHDFDSLASAKRYAIANNRLGDKSQFDHAALVDQLQSLDGLDGTGFDVSELEALDTTFEPVSADEQGSLDEKSPVICPECGHEFQL